MTLAIAQEQIERWKRDAQIAYHTKAYEGSFEKYWDLTIILRMDYPIPYAGYWDDAKAVKLAAWNEEANKHGEGQ